MATRARRTAAQTRTTEKQSDQKATTPAGSSGAGGGLRGFAALKARDPERLRAISSQAGRASQALGRGHVWSASEARAAGERSATNRRGRSSSSTTTPSSLSTMTFTSPAAAMSAMAAL